MKHLHHLIITIMLLTLLAACVAPTPASDTATNESNAAADDTAFPVTIEHDTGTITLDKPAERIVVFSEEFTELFVAMDLAPVGVALWRNEPTGDIFDQLPYLDQPIPGEPRYINGSEPNLEIIAALQPDLILNHEFSQSGTSELQESLSQIAPVLTYFGGEVGGWKRAIRGLGQATGHSERAESIIADYDARVGELQAAMHPITEQAPNVSLLLSGIEFVGIFDERFAIGGLMEVLGFSLSVPESVEMTEAGYANISAETLAEITANSVMQMRFNADQEHISDPILASLAMPTLHTEVYQGMGYTGPFAETIYLEGFAEAFQTEYGSDTVMSGDTLDCKAGFRVIEGGFGPTCIPEAPKRIIAMNENVMANLIALGTPPIAVQDWTRRDFTQYLGDTTGIIASVGTGDGPNYEAMLALKPDLILTMQNNVDDESMEILTQIAPVAVSRSDTVDWRGNILFTGEAVGKLAEAESLVEQTDARLAEFRTTYEAQAGDEEIAIIRSRADSFNIYHGNFFIVKITEDAGLKMPESFSEITERRLSLEAIELIEGDRLFVMVRNERESGAFLNLSASPLWQTIPAVQNDEVYLVNWSVWVAGWNIVGANLVIDDLYFFMLREEATTPNPLSDLIIPEYGPQFDEARLGLE